MQEFKFLVRTVEQISSEKPALTDYLALRAFVDSELLQMDKSYAFAEDSGTELTKSQSAYLELLQRMSADLSVINDGGIDGAIFNAESTARCMFNQWGLDKE